MIPPKLRSLNVQSIRFQCIQQVFSAVGQSAGGVSGSDESKGSVVGWIPEGDQGVLEGVEPIGHSVVFVAIEVGVPQEPMDDLCTHQIDNINANLSPINSFHPRRLVSITLIKDSLTSMTFSNSLIPLLSY